MNKGDLNRILNKLTAATPFLGDNLRSPVNKFSASFCEELQNFNPFRAAGAAIRRLSPEQAADINLVIKILHENFMRFMYIYCKCKAEQGFDNTPTNVSGTEAEKVTIKLTIRYDIEKKDIALNFGFGSAAALLRIKALRRLASIKLVLEKCRMLVLLESSINPDRETCNTFDYSQPTTQQNVEDIIGMLEPGIVEDLVQRLETISPENDPVAVADCVTVPVEQIETAFSNIPSIVTMGLVAAGVAGVAFWIRRGNFTKAMAAASAIAVTSGASAAEIQALQNALRGIAGPVMQQAANGQTFCPEPGTAGTSPVG